MRLISLFDRLPLLSIITFVPLAGALLAALIPARLGSAGPRRIATMVSAINLVLVGFLWARFDTAPAASVFQFGESLSWIAALGVRYELGVDGIAVLLLLLTTLISLVATISARDSIAIRTREFFVLMLVLQSGMIGVFCSLDLFLFYVFWEVMLVPMYFLIGVWGGERRLYAAIKFFLYTLAGSVLMLLSILALYYFNTTGIPLLNITGLGNVPSFDVLQFHRIGHLIPASLQFWIFLGFFFAFAVKVPLFPFHTWLPDAHVEAPTAASVILAAILLKTGAFGFVRFAIPILPSATREMVPWVAALALIGIIYGALIALVQKDAKRLVAYSSVSHLGLVMLGMFALNHAGISGSILQMVNHGLSTGALFLLVGLLYERTKTREIARFGGLARVTPLLATVFLIATLSSIGLPALNGFIGEFTILLGVSQRSLWWSLTGVMGIVLGAAYMLWLYQRLFWGPVDRQENETLRDLSGRELWTLLPLVACMFWIGLYPAPFFRLIDPSVRYVIEKIEPATGAARR